MSRLRTYRVDDAADAVRRVAHLRKPQRDSFDKIHDLIRGLDDDIWRLESARLYEQIADAGYQIDSPPPQLVFNLATGVGKTRLMGALIAYLYLSGQSRNFLILAPRTAILEKLERESSQHHPKYLLIDPDLASEPNICIRANLDSFKPDEQGLNVFILSPQSISGNDKRFFRAGEFRSESVADYLKHADDLIVFVDESHHLGDPGKELASWTQAVRDLKPLIYFGLTATPRTPAPGVSIVHSYDLAECLRDERYTKAVRLLVEPRDDKLTDAEWDEYTLDFALERLERKRLAIDAFRQEDPNFPAIEPVALICASDTKHADDIATWLKDKRNLSDEQLLVTHSERKLTEEEIRRLVAIDTPGSDIRVVVNVFRLTEGWDVTNVYVIAPLRQMATFSGALQTIGRGLRLPAGHRVGDPDVDTLDVLCCGKESLQAILDQATEEFGDSEAAGTSPIQIKDKSSAEDDEQPIATVPYTIEAVKNIVLSIPKVRLSGAVPLEFELDTGGSLGRSSVTAVDLKNLQTAGLAEGFRFGLNDLVRISAAHTIAELRSLSAFTHTAKVEGLIRQFLESHGASPTEPLAIDPIRLAKYIADEIERRRRAMEVTVEIVEGSTLEVSLATYEARVSEDFTTPLVKGKFEWTKSSVRVPIAGWKKCVHAAARFDTEGEYIVARTLDQSESVDWWCRNDPPRVRIPTPIGWFEPDFLYRTVDGVNGVLEIKADILWSPTGSDARIKSHAAKRWTETLNVVEGQRWSYALVIDDDARDKGSLEQLLEVAADREVPKATPSA